jgi:hypothetical protein
MSNIEYVDKMTPMERLGAFMTGKEMDRILIMPILVSIAHDSVKLLLENNYINPNIKIYPLYIMLKSMFLFI